MDRLPRGEPLFTRLEPKKAQVKSQLDQPQYYKDASSQLHRNETQSTAVDSNCPSHEQSTPLVMSSPLPNFSFSPYIKVEHLHEQTALLNPNKTEFESSSLRQSNVVSSKEEFGDQFNNKQNDASTNGQMEDAEGDQENGNQDDDDTSAVDHQQVHIPADNFVKHIEPDQLGNKFECDYEDCGKRTKYRTNLIRHIRTHTGERPFGCDWCGKAFATSTQLKCHARVHSEDRPFVCDMPDCTSVYKNRRSLRKHQLTKHNVL